MFIHPNIPGLTEKLTSTDTAQNLPLASFISNKKQVEGAIILVEIAPIRFALGGTVPTQAGLGGKLEPGSVINLESNEEVTTFQYISAESGIAATLQYTPQFPKE